MSASDDRLVEMWAGRKEVADEHRKNYEDRWYRNWQWYRNTKRTQRLKGQPWMSDVMLPDGFRVVETMVPQHVLNMYRNPNWFSVEAGSVPGETYQQIVKSLLLQGWRKADGYRKTIEGVKMGTILGHFIPKITWQVEVGEREVTDLAFEFTDSGEPIPAGFQRRTVPDVRYNGPQITFPSLFNLWQDPTGKERWWIERISSSYDELKQANKDFGGSLYRNLNKLSEQVAFRQAVGGPRTVGTDSQGLAEVVDGIPEYQDADAVELWQCWGYVPPSVREYDDTQWRLQVIANGGVLIRDVPAPTHDHRPCYVNVQAVPIPGQIYGDSVLSYIGDIIERRSQIENMRFNEVLLNIFKTYVIDGRFQIRGQEMFKSPGGALRVMPTEPGLDPRFAVQEISRSPVMPEAYNESAAKERQMLDASGATEPFQGTNFGSRTTATEVNLIANLGTGRFALSTMWMDESFKKPALERFFKLYQSRLTTPEIVQLAGQPNVQGEVDFTDLAYDVDIHVDSGLFGSMDQAQVQNMIQLYQVMVGNPETLAYVDPGRFVKQLAYRMGVNGADDFVRSPEEVAQIQQQAQQQQLLMAALGQGGPAGQ